MREHKGQERSRRRVSRQRYVDLKRDVRGVVWVRRLHLSLGCARSGTEGVSVDYAYKRVGTKGFAETIEAVEKAVRLHGFVVHQFHDIRARLTAKGFPIRPLVIFEIAPAEGADDEMLSLLLPCRINIYEEGESVVVAALRPTLFKAVFPEHELDAVAHKVEGEIIELVDAAVG